MPFSINEFNSFFHLLDNLQSPIISTEKTLMK